MIKLHSKIQHTNILSAYQPGGRYFAGKNILGTTYRNLLSGLSGQCDVTEGLLFSLLDNFLPDTTENFIEEWEDVVGIPDDCFNTNGTISERRSAILVKLAALSVQTTEDFIRIATIFGLSVNVIPGIESSLPLPDSELRFTILVQYIFEGPFVFPFTFPITFGDDSINTLTCLYKKIKPANCQVIFEQL